MAITHVASDFLGNTTGGTLSFSNISPSSGDLLVALVATSNCATTDTTPSGWTRITTSFDGSSSVTGLAVYYKISDGTETGVTFNNLSGNQTMKVEQYTGNATTGVLDDWAEDLTYQNSNTQSIYSGLATATAAGHALFAAVSRDQRAVEPNQNSVNNSFSVVDSFKYTSLTNYPGVEIYGKTISSGDVDCTQTTTDTGDECIGFIALFKAAGASGTTITATGIASAEAFGTATITTGGVSVSPTGIATAEVFGTATVSNGAVTISPTGISSLEDFGTPVINVGAITVSPSSITSGETFGTAIITLEGGLQTISPTGIVSLESFGTPVIVTGTIIVSPSSIASLEAMGIPVITTGSVGIIPIGIASNEVFGIAVVTGGDVTVSGKTYTHLYIGCRINI